jgi:ectoine hydroxylase-related dioxygenase (phytanoyl-CoA dioxygenase family)
VGKGAEKYISANEEYVNREQEKTAQHGDLQFVHLVVKSRRINEQTKWHICDAGEIYTRFWWGNLKE